MILLIASTIVLILCGSWSFSLYKNYVAARRTGLPVVVGVIDPVNPIWLLTKQYLGPLFARLPGHLGQNSHLNSIGWQFSDKHRTHDRLGKIFVHVTPSYNDVNIADPDVIQDVVTRLKEFVKPRVIYGPLDVFGPNLDTVEGDDWKRHRKLTVPCFNERVSSLVWEEGIRQGNAMLDSFLATADGLMNDINEACRIIALHILCYAGFGKRYDYGEGVRQVQEGHSLSYRDSLHTVLFNPVTTFVFPLWLLLSPLVPQRMRNVGVGVAEFRKYMEEMFQEERNSVNKDISKGSRMSLTSALIRASEQEKVGAKGQPSKGLSDTEIYGNMYIFNLAGHDTTANAMSYAIALMAIDPYIQDWIAEEVDEVFTKFDRNEYDKVFPRLKRTQALMLETLRLYPPAPYLPKTTGSQRVELAAYGKDSKQSRIMIPPNTFIMSNIMHLHTSPDFWGSDSLTFRPSRWINASNSESIEQRLESESLSAPQTAAFSPGFIPWSAGPRNCPGAKFSQVEFVSVISTLISRSRVEAALPPELQEKMKAQGSTESEIASFTRQRLQDLLDKSTMTVTTTIGKPLEVWLRWRKIS